MGAILGNVMLGLASDFAGIRSPFFQSSLLLGAVFCFVLAAAPPHSYYLCASMSFGMGFFAMGASIVMNAIMGDIGKALLAQGFKSVLTTIAGFNDGAGSFGSAFGQLIMGYVQQDFGWKHTIQMLGGLMIVAALPSLGYLVREVRDFRAARKVAGMLPKNSL